MKRILAWLAAGVVLALLQPEGVSAQVACVEECVTLQPGFGCSTGDQGEGCEATLHSCMIDNCNPVPWGIAPIRSADGVLYYAMIRCNASPLVVPAHTAVMLVDDAEREVAAEPTVAAEEPVDAYRERSAIDGTVQ